MYKNSFKFSKQVNKKVPSELKSIILSLYNNLPTNENIQLFHISHKENSKGTPCVNVTHMIPKQHFTYSILYPLKHIPNFTSLTLVLVTQNTFTFLLTEEEFHNIFQN